MRRNQSGSGFTAGKRYRIAEETMGFREMCYVVFDDRGSRNYFTIEPDSDGKSYRDWFTLEIDEEPRVGDVVKPYAAHAQWETTLTKRHYEEDGIYGKAWKHTHDSGWIGEDQVYIIDDSREEVAA
ncbi:hypothetical protein [Paenibacillus campinasensis]|uniref:hypothetical protein n=1 Tax=Paenibacillus campinasensis TaxID=66347 RepID=UPI00117E82A9|nr:hypothetical protein [Paenibacillus campinasensis]